MDAKQFALMVETFQHPTIILREQLQEDYAAGKITLAEYVVHDEALANEAYLDAEEKMAPVIAAFEYEELTRQAELQRKLNAPGLPAWRNKKVWNFTERTK
jgi:hypothetical protein